MNGVILSVGDELLRGDIVDTNASFLARELSGLGIQVRRVEQVEDDLTAVRETVLAALADAQITVATGGLGPTQDDLTRDGIAAAIGEDMYYDDDQLAHLESLFKGMGRRMTERNKQQAMLIPSAEGIPNAHGTAPGWFARKDDRIVVAMPGPPSEMEPMWRDHVLPQLKNLMVERTGMVSLMTFGLGESAVEERIQEIINWRPDVTVATYAKSNGVQVHITARAGTEEAALELSHEAEQRVRKRLGEAVFGSGDETLAFAVGRVLDERHHTLAVMESCTGGLLASLITDQDGSSDHFLGGIVAYSPDVKKAYGVDPQILEEHGLYSEATAIAMAKAVRRELASDIGIGVTGIAGTEPQEGKPAGTCYLGLSMDGVETVREIRRPGRREVVKRFAAQSALDLLRRELARAEAKGQ